VVRASRLLFSKDRLGKARTTNARRTAMPAKNKSLQSLHNLLLRQALALSHRLDDETNVDVARGILREQQEFVHRINLVAGLLFVKQTQAVTQKVKGVNAASRQLTKALKSAGELTSIIAASTAVLAIVDEVVDLAKVIA
jgi:hypothetical protein